MRKYLYSLFCLCTALTAVPCFGAPDVWGIYDDKPQAVCNQVSLTGDLDLATLTEAAICNNPALKISYLSALSAGAAYGQGLAEYMPSVNLSGSVSANNQKQDGGASDKTSPLGASANVNWLLLDFGGRGANADRLKAALQSSYFAYDNTLQTLLYDVAATYYSALSATEKYEGLLTSEESSKKSFEEASSRYKLGLVPLSDKLQAQTSYDQARLASNVARKNIAIELGNLATLLNVSPDLHFKLVRPEKNVTDKGQVEAFDQLVAKALSARPDFKAAEYDVLASQKQIDVAKSDGLPYLSAGASASANKDIRSGSAGVYSGSAGLTLTVPFFTGFSSSYKIGQAQAQYEKAQKTLQQTKDTILNEVWAAVQDYQTSLESFKISKSLLASAEENERVAFASYKVGKVNILTLLDAQSSLASARVEHSTTFYNFLTAKVNLQKVLGQMERVK